MGRAAAEAVLALGSPPPGMARGAWLHEALRRAILSGRLKPGTRLPASRDLARQQGVARGTVVAAYEQLAAEGYVVGATGRGTFVARDLPDDLLAVRPASEPLPAALPGCAARFARSPFAGATAPVRPFRASLPDLAAFPLALWTRLAGREARRLGTALLGEIDGVGYLPLRIAIRDHLALARGVECDVAQVAIVASVQQALDLVARLVLAPGEAAWVEDPGYPAARQVLQAAGAQLVAVEVDGQGLDVAAGMVRAPAARLVHLTAGRHAPLGHVLSLDRRLALLRWAGAAGAYVFDDDYDAEHRFADRPLPALKSLDGGDRVIHAGTFSKLMFPGLRLAYAVLPRALAPDFADALSLTARHQPQATQATLAAFMAEGHFARHVRRMRMLYAERAAAFAAAGRREWGGRLVVPPIMAGLDVACRLADGFDDRAVAAAALAAGITAVPLSRYAVERSDLSGLVLGFGAFEPAGIADAARRLGAVLASAERQPADQPGCGD